MAACRCAQVRRFPATVVRVRIGPVRVVAEVESPCAIEQRGGGTQCGWVGSATDRQDRDHAAQRHRGNYDDPDHENPAW